MHHSFAARLTRPRLIILAAVLAIAGLLIAVAGQTGPAHAATGRAAHPSAASWIGGPKPIIVLVHGAWADSGSWNGVIWRLQLAGYTVYAPPNPLRGVSYDSTYLADFLSQPALAGQPIVLVGHSYGGFLITNAATNNPNVKALVYDDAFIPAQGDTLEGLASAVPGSCLNPATSFNPAPYPDPPVTRDVDLYVKQSLFPSCFANGIPGPEAAVLAATQRPLAESALGEQSGPPAWTTIPSWAIIGTADHVIPPAGQLFMAQRAGASVTEIDAPHLSMITDPGAVASIIIQAAQATS
jgi:pimeloyl-ACP methyl ester carboxylesterase